MVDCELLMHGSLWGSLRNNISDWEKTLKHRYFNARHPNNNVHTCNVRCGSVLFVGKTAHEHLMRNGKIR